MTTNFIFDFDSTIVKAETLNEVLNISIGNDADKIKEVENFTKLAMEGKISFRESLEGRLKISTINKELIEKITEKTLNSVVFGIKELIEKLQEKNANIFIVSGGFTEMIIPTAKYLNIPEKNIFANKFIFNNDNDVVGVAETLLLQEAGKAKMIEELKKCGIISGKTIMIGDGYTDLETYLMKAVDDYICFCGVVVRDNVKNQATNFAMSVQELEKMCLNIL